MESNKTHSTTLGKVVFSPDILESIFALLSRRDTYSSARVCKIWADRAIPSIWMNHGVDFRDLLTVLSHLEFYNDLPAQDRNRFAWASETIRSSYSLVRLGDAVNSISNDRWSRFLHFSKYIRALIAGESQWEISTNTLGQLAELSKLHGCSVVFPNLRIVTGCWINKYNRELLTNLLLLPAISSFQMANGPEFLEDLSWIEPLSPTSGKLPLTLDHILQHSPRLEVLELKSIRDAGVPFVSLRFQGSVLMELSTDGPLCLETLKSILETFVPRQMSLKKFSFTEPSSPSEREAVSWLELPILLPLVESFEFEGDGYYRTSGGESWMRFFQALQLPALKKASLSQIDLKEELLLSFSRAKSELRSLTLSFQGASVDDGFMQALVTLPTLKELTLTKFDHSWDHNFFREWLSHMPQLEVLELYREPDWRYVWTHTSRLREYLPFNVLFSISSSCTKLKSLVIAVEVSEFSTCLKEPPSIPLFPSLTKLSLTLVHPRDDDIPLLSQTLLKIVPPSSELEIFVGDIARLDLHTGWKNQPAGDWGKETEILDQFQRGRIYGLIEGMKLSVDGPKLVGRDKLDALSTGPQWQYLGVLGWWPEG